MSLLDHPAAQALLSVTLLSPEEVRGCQDRRLYLPKGWAADARRRGKCHVPKKVTFREV